LNTEIAFLQLVTLELVIKDTFHLREINYEDFEIYGIPVKTATLHNNDFVNKMQSTKLTLMIFCYTLFTHTNTVN
jgi:hypothetical protein